MPAFSRITDGSGAPILFHAANTAIGPERVFEESDEFLPTTIEIRSAYRE